MQYTSEQVIGYNTFENSTLPLFYAHSIEYEAIMDPAILSKMGSDCME